MEVTINLDEKLKGLIINSTVWRNEMQYILSLFWFWVSWHISSMIHLYAHSKTQIDQQNYPKEKEVEVCKYIATYRQLRAKKALMNIQRCRSLRTRQVLSLNNVYGNSALLVLNGTSLNSDSALLVLNGTSLNSDSALLVLNGTYSIVIVPFWFSMEHL